MVANRNGDLCKALGFLNPKPWLWVAPAEIYLHDVTGYLCPQPNETVGGVVRGKKKWGKKKQKKHGGLFITAWLRLGV